jgi:hypothetical protein
MGKLLVAWLRASADVFSITTFFNRILNPPGTTKNRPFIIMAVLIPPVLLAGLVPGVLLAVPYVLIVGGYLILLDGLIATGV